jgi:hypothetical protein
MDAAIQGILITVKGIMDLFGLTPYIVAFAVIGLVSVMINTFFHK